MTAGGEGFRLQHACGGPGLVLQYWSLEGWSIIPLGAFLEEDCGIGITCWRLQFLDTAKKQ